MRKAPTYRVIIVDTRQDRSLVWKEVLEGTYGTSPMILGGWDALEDEMSRRYADKRLRAEAEREGLSRSDLVDVIILAASATGGNRSLTDCAFIAAEQYVRNGRLVVVLDSQTHCLTPKANMDILVTPRGRLTRAAADGELARFLRRGSPPIVIDLSDDDILRDIVRSLHSEHDLDAGTRVLGQLIQNVTEAARVVVTRMTQGYSGAKVLLVKCTPPSTTGHFVLKISSSKDDWKLRNEVDNWENIEAALAPGAGPGEGGALRRFLPNLVPLRRACSECRRLVAYNGFHAVAYQFLGDPIGSFICLQDAWLRKTDGRAGLAKFNNAAQMGEELLKHAVERLGRSLYSTATVVTDTPIWTTANIAPRKVLSPPPYGFAASQKAQLLGAIEALENEEGKRLVATWADDVERVNAWLKSGPPTSFCNTMLPLICSRVHGDLNSSNIFYWLDEKQPFFIDFACFQERGHVLQDYARLEVEIKYALMDREVDSELKSLDLTEGQLPQWCALESHVMGDNWEADPTLSGEHTRSVVRAHEAVKFIRAQARALHTTTLQVAGLNVDNFIFEYKVPLLYHTLRAVGYVSLSPFKRILALHSAARIIRDLTAPKP